MSNPTILDIEVLFEDIWSQLFELHQFWRMYVTFYGSADATKTVRRAALFTFGRLQPLLYDVIVLRLDQLLEVPVSRGKRSASIATLLNWIPDVVIRRDLKKRLAALRTQCRIVSERRNRRIGHRDLEVVLETVSVDDVAFRTVRYALEELSAIMTVLGDRYRFPVKWDFGPDTEAALFDADLLLEKLKRLPS